eukprot:s2598_g5.t1
MPNALSMWFVLGSCSMTALQVGELLQRWGPCFDVTVIGWGTISSIPRLPGLSAEELLHELSKVSRFVMNVVSSTNNHVKFQRRYQGQLPSEIMGATESHWAPFSRADPESQRQNRPPHEFPNGSVYEGQWVGPAREGHGVQTWPDGACYTGQWVKDGLQLLIATGDASSGGDNLLTDKAQGMGKFVHAAGDWYEGQYLDDMQHGYGVAMYMDGSKYTGNFWCDKHHGDGVEVWPDGKRFQGTYYQGIKHGQGTFRWPDGSSYIGNFEANNLSGIGTYAWADGRSYTGEWEKNTMHGKGTFSYGDGRSYTGDFFEDVKHGHGVFSWPDGRQYDGEWKNGKRHGKGRRDTAMRTAWSETDRPEVKLWLEKKIGLATFDRSYYYTVDTKQNMFYSAISADLEAARLKEAGYDSVRVQICNIINFFDIQTKPRAARINAAVIRLLERRDVWGAQLLLSRGVAKAFKKPLSSLQTGSCIFDNSSEHALYGQVARYFISTGESAQRDGANRSAGILLKQVPHRVHRAIEPSTDAAIVQGAATWSCAGARCHFQGQPFNSIQEVHSTGGALVRRCKHRHWCSCKETEGKWSRGILGNLPWSIQESDSSDEDVSSLEWKPTILSADGSRYTGQWKGSTWQGEGQLELADGSTYEGCFKDGKPHGVGCLKGPDGCVYQGQWRQGRAHGMGKYTKAAGAGTYEGQWMEDKRSGLGTELWADGCLYRGSFQNGCKHGRGFYQTPQGASYNGSFQADQMHGEGVYKFPDGRVYSGSFKSGQMTGYGHMSWPSGAAYEGQYLNGEKHGPGVYTWPDGRAWSQRALATLAGLGLGCALLANKASPTARAAEPAGGRKVCIVGEALFDFLPVKTTDGKQAFLPRPGGAPLNVCIAASRMGAKVSFLGALSSDMFGEELYKTLQADNVDLSMVKRLPNPSTLAFVSKPPGSDVRYAFFKENAADRSLSARGVAELLSGKSFGALHVSLGAITLEDSVLAEAFEQAYKNTHSTKGFTSFDPNLRGPMVKSSPSLYAGRIEAFAQHADLIKSSDADIEFLYGAGADLEAVAKKWLQKGSKLVIVTRGPDGATAYFRGKSGQITSLAVKPPCESPKTIDLEGNPAPVADTVGAGDTCMGTLLCYLLGEDGGAPLVDQLFSVCQSCRYRFSSRSGGGF